MLYTSIGVGNAMPRMVSASKFPSRFLPAARDIVFGACWSDPEAMVVRVKFADASGRKRERKIETSERTLVSPR